MKMKAQKVTLKEDSQLLSERVILNELNSKTAEWKGDVLQKKIDMT